MQRVFRLVDTAELRAVGTKTTSGFYRSVQRHGIINPIIVAEVADADGVIGLEIVDGNRRVRAAKAARMEKIPAVVLKETSPEDRARLTLMANHLRSANFHTESLAVSLLADNDEEARRAAAEMGVTPSKLQGIHKKLATMPAEILKAMYEGRVPVSSATSIAGWPEELQRQIVTLLQREHRLITPMIDEVRRDYERQHPPSPKTPRFESLPPAPEPPPFDDWFEDDPSAFFAPTSAPVIAQPAASILFDTQPTVSHGTHQPAPPTAAVAQSSAPPSFTPPAIQTPTSPPNPDGSPVDVPDDSAEASEQPAEVEAPASVQPTVGPTPAAPTPSPVPAPEPVPAETANDPREFVKRLDGALLALALETRGSNLSRAAWIDRCMRAWDLSETE